MSKHRALKPKRKHRVITAIGVTLALLLAGAGVAGFLAYRHLNGNITGLQTDALGTDRPDEATPTEPTTYKPMNILLLGSDTRSGETEIDGVAQGLSDTTILLHLSGDRERAYAISIPRDTMVERPTCPDKYGKGTIPGGLSMFNAAYSLGGPLCTIKTVESITNIRINHFVIMDFRGFRKMVDAIGGVKMCVPTEVNDTIRNIYIKAGTYNMDGKTALTYVRERHVLSPNGDIGRMKRQQVFLAAMVNKVISAGTLLNPVKLFNFLDAATKSITVDEDIASLKDLMGLAQQLRNIGLDRIQFLTIPNEPYAPDPNRLQFAPGAAKVWERMRLDEPLTKNFGGKIVKASDDPLAKPTAKPTTAAQIAAEEKRKEEAQQYGLCY